SPHKQLYVLITPPASPANYTLSLHDALPIFELQGVRKSEREERSKAMLTAVGLEDLFHRRPHEMSGGQQQRVAIARAVVSNPERSEEHTSELQSRENLVCRLLLEKKK